MRKPPRFTHGYVDRHGKPRWYLRRRGCPNIPLPGLPWSPEFMAAYEAALNGQGRRSEIGASRTQPGSVSALVVKFYRSAEWAGLASSTQITYRGILERFRAEHGDKPVALLQRENVRTILARKAATPHAANNLRKLIRLLMRFAIEEGWRRDDPTIEVRAVKVRSDGFYTWTEDDIAAFKRRWAVGTKQRLAMELALNTGQRRLGFGPHGQAAHSQRANSGHATKDQHEARHSHSWASASCARFYAFGAPDVLDDNLWPAIYARGVWRLV